MNDPQPFVANVADLLATSRPTTYNEVLRVPTLSLGLFAAPVGHQDNQSPHDVDEVYVIVGGSAVLVIDRDPKHVSAGSIAYVPAGVPHHFEEITHDLRVVVLFAPPPPWRAAEELVPVQGPWRSDGD